MNSHRVPTCTRRPGGTASLYLPTEASAPEWDQLEAARRRPDATICLVSALAHHDLTDAIPAALDVAIPRGSRSPASTGAIAWHQFDRLPEREHPHRHDERRP
jgi:hypothetical protein